MNLPNSPIEIFQDKVRVGAKVSIPSTQHFYELAYNVCEVGRIKSITNNIATIDLYLTDRMITAHVDSIKIIQSATIN